MALRSSSDTEVTELIKLLRSTRRKAVPNICMDEVEVFVHPPPDELKCPVCFELFVEPVITRECGHTFCKICFLKSLDNRHNCPTCRAPAYPDHIHPNRIVAGVIDQLLIHCKYGLKQQQGDWIVDKTGCTVAVKRGHRRDHEDVCPFALVNCPHSQRGCSFSGTKTTLPDHLLQCHYEAIKHYILKSEEQHEEMKQQLKMQAIDMSVMKKKLDQLTKIIAAQSKEVIEEPEPDQFIEYSGSKDILMMRAVEKGMVCRLTLTSHEDTVESLVVDNSHVYSASWDHTIKVWDTETWECTNTLKCASDVRELLTHEGKLYTGCGNGTIQVWDVETLHSLRSTRKHTDDVLALTMLNGRLFSASSDTTIKMWDSDTLDCLETVQGHNNWVFALVSAHDKVFSGSSDQCINVWDVGNSNITHAHTIVGHSDQIRALATSGGALVSGSYDCTIKMWDVRSYKCTQTLQAGYEIFGLGATNTFLFSGDEHGNVKIWDLRNLQCVQTLMDHTGSVYAFAVHEGTLLSASSDTTIKVWGV